MVMNVSTCPIRSNFSWDAVNVTPMSEVVVNKEDRRYRPTPEELWEKEQERIKKEEEEIAATKASVEDVDDGAGEKLLCEQRVLTAK